MNLTLSLDEVHSAKLRNKESESSLDQIFTEIGFAWQSINTITVQIFTLHLFFIIIQFSEEMNTLTIFNASKCLNIEILSQIEFYNKNWDIHYITLVLFKN